MNHGQEPVDLYYYLDKCCKQVGETYGKPDSGSWVNGDYVRLSHTLFQKANVRISPNTLKRTFGKLKTSARYYPQKATRDALASYIGYQDWEDFVQEQSAPDQSFENVADKQGDQPVIRQPENSRRVPGTKPRRWIWLTSVILMIACIAMVMRKFSNKSMNTIPNNRVKLVCKNPLGKNPHSAIFTVTGLEQRTSSLLPYVIEFGDGDYRHVKGDTTMYNHYYERPGRYFAVLKKGHQAIDTAIVYSPTKGWEASVSTHYVMTRVYPLESKKLFTNGNFGISTREARQAGVDTTNTFYSDFYNSQLTNIDGDNFELTTRLATTPQRPGIRCSEVRIMIYGDSSLHMIDALKPNCVYWVDLQFSEFLIFGRWNDLKSVGVDLRNGGTLTLRVIDQHASFYINNRKVYVKKYRTPLNQIYGVRIMFTGVGKVYSFSLKDLKTGVRFKGNF